MIVIKLGGGSGNRADRVVADVPFVRPCILVHGGSAAADELASAIGRPARFLTSPSGVRSRRTDPVAIDVISMAIAGRINTSLVAALHAAGVPAVGLSGVDGALLTGRRKRAVRATEGSRIRLVRDDRSGTVDRVNLGLLRGLLEAGYVPVVSPPILDAVERIPLNADADRIAARIAGTISADALVFLTNVPGVLRSPSDPTSVVARIPAAQVDSFLAAASNGMRKKLVACREAIEAGVPRAVIGDSRRAAPVRAALAGEGTVIA